MLFKGQYFPEAVWRKVSCHVPTLSPRDPTACFVPAEEAWAAVSSRGALPHTTGHVAALLTSRTPQQLWAVPAWWVLCSCKQESFALPVLKPVGVQDSDEADPRRWGWPSAPDKQGLLSHQEFTHSVVSLVSLSLKMSRDKQAVLRKPLSPGLVA